MENCLAFKVGAGGLAGWVLTAQKEWEEKARGPLLKATTVSLGRWETAAPAEQGQGKKSSGDEPQQWNQEQLIPVTETQTWPCFNQSICIWLWLGEKWGRGSYSLMKKIQQCILGICFIKMFALKELSAFCLLALCYLNITFLITRYAVDPTRGI